MFRPAASSAASSLLLLSALLPTLLLLVSAAPSTGTSTPRRGHSATYIQDTVYFVGGLATATGTDGTPVKTFTALNLTQLTFTEMQTSLAVYNHSASSNRTLTWDPTTGVMTDNSTSQIAISFGQSSASNPGVPLQWLDPATGEVTVAGSTMTSSPSSPSSGSGNSSGGSVSPESRIAQSLVQFDNTLLVLGGRGLGAGATPTAVNDTMTYDLTSKSWTNRTTGLARSGHASARVGLDYVLTCYGSSTAGTTLDSDCVYFTASTSVFVPAEITWANNSDAIVGGRTGFTMVANPSDNGLAYLFGGCNLAGTTYFQDVYLLDASKPPSLLITKLPTPAPSAILPSARAQHAAVAVGTTASGFMVVYGGVIQQQVNATANATAALPTMAMALATPFFFDMTQNIWVDNGTFMNSYAVAMADMAAAAAATKKHVGVATIIAGILAGVAVLGGMVALYIWSGLKQDERERLQKEARGSVYVGENSSPEQSPMDKRNVYPLSPSGEEMATGPFKSTTSLIQPDKEEAKRLKARGSGGLPLPWIKSSDPYTPSGTTLNDNGSYFSSSAASSMTPSRLTKNNSNGSSQYSRQGSAAGSGSAVAPPAAGYYNNQDLFLDDPEDDDCSVVVSLASESSTLSPWAGPVRLSNDLAPPNPRFSRGAISQAHRQLVGNSFAGQRNSQGAYSNSNSGWDTSSPGGSLSSREDEYHRRSVNSMQWVGFEPLDLTTRPESGIFDPLTQQQRSNLTVRNASLYGPNAARGSLMGSGSGSNQPRMSMFGDSNASDSNAEDSPSSSSQHRHRPYSGQGTGTHRISTALAARQQRRSVRVSQDSQSSLSAGGGSQRTEAGEPAFVTSVLPVITHKVTKPTLAKVVTHQRGSRVVVPSAGPLGDRPRANEAGLENGGSTTGDGLGIDFSSFSNDSYSFQPPPPPSSNRGRRPSSTLNPSYNKATAATTKRESSRLSIVQNSPPNVILKMPPPPKHTNRNNLAVANNTGNSDSNGGAAGGQAGASTGLRHSIMELGQDMPGFLNYGDNL
ncbi:hypothetical protein EMPS_04740 [Entomortierella parvispora]|uniref:Galactose oxidase n=1 Tax=Entomortierella parvispora TaxID=205924 RepID=A0A9P3LVS9_9FUNG|nr:hypothetical protein EMPS_04740 [Entomortierella parvispora]